MNKTKKKPKIDKIPKPINIKKEKTEEDRTLHPISHYVDDRLELIKQIFGTLKPKTITNLAPEFLKNKHLEEIEELCLNELLCISAKRLLSIINATKCPTDTESSEDSDVEHKQEHISLEEISSDSEIDGNDSLRKVKKKKKRGITPNRRNANEVNIKKESDGGISVLELLELQARARAIRSQLALEPVTKIEVDSDAERVEKTQSKTRLTQDGQEKWKQCKRKSSTQESEKSMELNSINSKDTRKDSEVSEQQSTVKRTSKKIKLKRNFRKINTEPKDEPTVTAPTADAVEESNTKIENNKSRSASPDVIPIQPEPVTLLISDSSDDEAKQKTKANNMEKSDEQTVEQNLNNEQKPEPQQFVRRKSQTEEGEITDSEEALPDLEECAENSSKECQQIVAMEQSCDTVQSDKTCDHGPEQQEQPQQETKIEETNVEQELESIKTETETELQTASAEDSGNQYNSNLNDDDDVISIEGGDLESEMNEQLAQVEAQSEATRNTAQETTEIPEEEDDDIISLDTSEDDANKSQDDNTESWHTRYLKSSKVSQVLAASRLGKRVRDKIKKSKRAKKDSEHVKDEELEQKSRQTFTSKHEDGSIEQYKELLELRQQRINLNELQTANDGINKNIF